MSAEIVYGRNPVRELIAAGRRPIHSISALAQVAKEPWLSGRRVRVVDRARLGQLASSSDHQGVVAEVGPYPYAEARDLIVGDGPLVCLDGAHDPRNIGAIARVAEGAGAAGLVMPSRGVPGITAVVAKASAGAVEHLPIARVTNIAAFLHEARDAGRLCVGAHPEGAEDYRGIDWGPVPTLVLGAEGEGLRPRVRDACQVLAHIPMSGRVASLNLSVACGVLLYEAIRNTK